jgi:adenylosuccinate lyase
MITDDALSPLDGRYAKETAPLREYWTEPAFLRQRVQVEIDYLLALSHDTQLVRPFTEAEVRYLESLVAEFGTDSVQAIKEIEAKTRHDVKAIELFLRKRLGVTSLRDVVEWLHFGLTSEDVNLIAQARALYDSRDRVMLPALDAVLAALAGLVREYQDTPMLARTHGQPAVPTTLGKELAVFWVRLNKQRELVRTHRFEAKLTGAVGDLNALVAAAPEVDWLAFGAQFVRRLGLEPNLFTTQLLPFDNWLEYFDALRRINSILVDLTQDLWRYISDDYLKSAVVDAEVGSSTMPQKVNPIDFENAEGNLGLANALFVHYASKLPISRLQRDLSDSTVRRTFGVALGHTLLAYTNLTRGLNKIKANEDKLLADLEAHWDVIAEGAQTILRRAHVENAYDQLKALTRGKGLTREAYAIWVETLPVEENVKGRLRALSPRTYVGVADKIAERALQAKS